ncbi:glyoxylase-like metal-dependent hydrolase (beta-lactamase superfamily II) [Tenacibaculum lutimaris]|uniref:beta-lactamase n=1 Tax=Tenacibaculum lutimaris TaxID=285258 RepID=A0A420E0L0_9FLAO|nr:MBL fold metallo-hydrolase [Tenacibaculum lutimaris]RKF03644.1 glyoxylase-like metal-dependent hydrolase (beta-lactamase superfamily II) [Tenacibaculum lutimaris]
MKALQLIFIIFFFSSLNLTSQEKEVKITVEKLTDRVYVLKGQGGNIGLFIGDDCVFMIDDQFAPLSKKIQAAIKTITDKPVTYLINTHWHGDHTGGNANFQKEGAIIVSHENVRKRMSVDQIVRGEKRLASPEEALPVITFSEDMQFYMNKEPILITHVHNAHTDGDVLVYFVNSNVLHVGDAYFQGKFPYIDIDSGGSIDGYIKGIKTIMRITDTTTKIIPGHGKVTTKEELKEYLEMLEDLKTQIFKEIEKGASLKDVKNNAKITEKYKGYNGWITEDKIKEAIYKSLKIK